MSSVLRGSPNFIWSTQDILGQGATGAVYKGRHKRTGELIAIKTFNQVSHLRPLEIQKREFEVLKKLNHENIVRLLAIEEESQNHNQVLVMELCNHGSLYHLLDQPENAHGLPEDEYLTVLKHVAAGMMHLRENGIVHRDIKPGNIMKYEDQESGRFIYKLIDFGAARELEDDGQFMSLYGTEEYLHPDLYQRAVLRRPMSKRQFGVGVDLWSLGVTLYHAATGELPFKPFGGRKNKEAMFRITTEKASGVISGVQEKEGGPIIWKRELPNTCRLSMGAQSLLTPILAGLMECDTRRMIDFPDFFIGVSELQGKRVVHVFSVTTANLLHVYLGEMETYSRFQELVATQAFIAPTDQTLLFENLPINQWVDNDTRGKDFPATTRDNPFFLYHNVDKIRPKIYEHEITPYPSITVQLDLEGDVPLAKTCAGIMALLKLRTEETIHTQAMLIKAAMMFSVCLRVEVQQSKRYTRELLEKVEEAGKRMKYHGRSTQGMVSVLQLTQRVLQKTSIDQNAAASMSNSITRMQQLVAASTAPQYGDGTGGDGSVHEACNQIRYRLDNYFTRLLGESEFRQRWREAKGCPEPDRCVNKSDYLLRMAKKTIEDFRRDRGFSSKLSYNEEQIHKFDKSKLAVNGTKAFSILQGHCFPNTKKLFSMFHQWYREAWELRKEFTGIEKSVSGIVEVHSNLSASMDQSQVDHEQGVGEVLSALETADPDIHRETVEAYQGSLVPSTPVANVPPYNNAGISLSSFPAQTLHGPTSNPNAGATANVVDNTPSPLSSLLLDVQELDDKFGSNMMQSVVMEEGGGYNEPAARGRGNRLMEGRATNLTQSHFTTQLPSHSGRAEAGKKIIHDLVKSLHEVKVEADKLRSLVNETDDELNMLDELQDEGATNPEQMVMG